MCTCQGRLRCTYHAQAELDRQTAARRITDNALMAIARDWTTFPDDMWARALYRYVNDDLHLLLEGKA